MNKPCKRGKLAGMRMADDEKDLEILQPRQKLQIAERKQVRGPQIPRGEKVPLAGWAVRLRDKASSAREALAKRVRLFKPDTLVGWVRVMRKECLSYLIILNARIFP